MLFNQILCPHSKVSSILHQDPVDNLICKKAIYLSIFTISYINSSVKGIKMKSDACVTRWT